jgi:hypothetical protein
MLDSELYARDVLLVCEAFAGQELQQLGSSFVQATRASKEQPSEPADPPAGLVSDQADAMRTISSSTSRSRSLPNHS